MPTVGQILVDDVLPEDMRGRNPVLDIKGLSALLREVGEKHPDKYRDISFKLGQIGHEAAFTTGGNSFGLQSIRRSASARKRRHALQQRLDAILDNDDLTDDQRDNAMIKLAGGESGLDREEIFEESMAEGNPLAEQLMGAGRGSKMSLASLRGSDWLYQDHRGRIIPVPVTRGYSQGLSPLEYWAGTYGARAGVISAKFATQDAGFFAKQLQQISHRNMVTDLDRDGEPDTLLGLPVDVEDSDSEGALLANPVAGYKRNTVLTPKILRHIKRQGHKRILVRSPVVSGSPSGGVYGRDAGVREFGRIATVGEQIGMTAAQALSEPISQGMLGNKHSGGVAGEGASLSGFDYLNQLVQVPKTFKGGAAHATLDGTVQGIEEAPAGGHFVTVDNEKHYVASGYELRVKPGDKVEAGDILSEGIPNPALVTKYKGVGEGRRYFVKAFTQAMNDSNMRSHRRNVELLARGLINHVRLTDEIGDFAPNDVVPYSMLEHSYKPRQGGRSTHPKGAVGSYLERPYLHYSIGTKIKPSMLPDFQEFGVKSVDVHQEPPPFEAEMVRGMSNLQHDPDWMTRMFGSGLKGSLLKGVYRGATSDTLGTSFVPGLAKAVNFGREGLVKSPDRELD